jgi:hypothetical protein
MPDNPILTPEQRLETERAISSQLVNEQSDLAEWRRTVEAERDAALARNQELEAKSRVELMKWRGWHATDQGKRLAAEARIKELEARLRAALEGKDALPQVADLIGLDPDFTGGLSAEEYVRKVRDEDA